eukprot:11961493-Ditylum_brightwellii.AAC.2
MSPSRSDMSPSWRNHHSSRGNSSMRNYEEPGAVPAQHPASSSSSSPSAISSSSASTTSPSMHIAHRVPSDIGCSMLLPDGTNALDAIHGTWARIERLSDSIRKGNTRGVTGSVIRDVVVVGKGVPVAALRFLYEALRRDEEAERAASDYLSDSGGGIALPGSTKNSHGSGSKSYSTSSTRRMRFVSSVDPVASASAVSDLNPATTIVVTVTGLGSHKRPDLVVSRHMLLVTGNEKAGRGGIVKPEGMFLIPEHTRCEAFTTFTAAGLLIL